MNKRGSIRRFKNYYQKQGFFRTLGRISEQPNRIISKGHRLLFYAETNELDDSVFALPPDIVIDCVNTYSAAIQPEMQRMISYWDSENMMEKVIKRFNQGAILWILRKNGTIAGFGWSIRGKMVHPFYLPLTINDAVLFDYVTFEEYRGLGFYTRLLNYILGKLRLENVSRVYVFVSAWNNSSIRGIEKSYFRKLSKVRIYQVLGRNITIWSQ